MSDAFRFETFVDVHGNIFNEYLSSVVARLSKEDEEYKALQEKIEGIYEEYPKVLAVFDSETESELTEKECAALIEVMELKISSRTWRCRRCTSVAAMTVWVI